MFQCLGIWDLDIRGHYKGIWRLYFNSHQNEKQDSIANAAEEQGIPRLIRHSRSGSELIIVGCPYSYFW